MHRKELDPNSWTLEAMFLTILFGCLLHKRDRGVVGTSRKSHPGGRQMHSFSSSSWDPNIPDFYLPEGLLSKIIYHRRGNISSPLGQLALNRMVSGLRSEDLQTDKLHSPSKVSWNISHINSTLIISTWLIYSFQFILPLSWQSVTWKTEKARSQIWLPVNLS